MHRELGVVVKATDASGLADELGGGEHAAAGKREQRWRLCTHERRDLALELECSPRELATATHELATDPYLRRMLGAGKAPCDALEPAAAIQTARRQLERWLELVQVPAQALLDAGALGDEILAVVGEQADLPLGAVQTSARQVGLAHTGARDRDRVDGHPTCRELVSRGGRLPSAWAVRA